MSSEFRVWLGADKETLSTELRAKSAEFKVQVLLEFAHLKRLPLPSEQSSTI